MWPFKKGKFGVAPYAKGECVQVVHDDIQIQSTENNVRTAAKMDIAKSVELFSSAIFILFFDQIQNLALMKVTLFHLDILKRFYLKNST